MKISCQSCQAKYTIADEKVLGKIVKIRCKKCGATIVINGNDSDATQANTAHTEDYTANNEQWTVNVAEGDQRTLTQAEIVAEYKSGVVNDDTFCWKDGMNDWLPVREIEGLYAACTMGPGPALHTAGEFAPMSVRDAQHQQHAAAGTDDEFPTQVGGATDFSLFGGASAAAETNGNGASLFGAAQPARRNSSRPEPGGGAARRTGGRGNQGADLFGNVSQAGGEDDVMTSAPQGGGGGGRAAPAVDEKLTGQRNENSVLFSLNALTQTAPKDTSGAPVADGSGLIDIKALSASMGSEAPKSQRHVDDIMNLGGGGAFSAALAAPILAPPTHQDEYTSGGTPARGKNTLLYVIIGGCVIMAMAMIIVALIVTGGSKKEATDSTTSPTGSTTASAAPTDSAALNTAPTTSVTAPTASAAPTGPVAKAPNVGSGGAQASNGGAKSHPSGGDSLPPAQVPDPPKAAAAPKSLAGAMSDSVGGGSPAPPPAAPTGGTSPFDRGAAAAALGGVNVATCKKPDGPSGSGHVKVTFSPNGNVSTAEVDSPPFQGTGVGGCIAGKFRAAHIPAFAGGPVTVGKSFSLN